MPAAADRDKLRKRLSLGKARIVQAMSPGMDVPDRLPVVPPALRPMVASRRRPPRNIRPQRPLSPRHQPQQPPRTSLLAIHAPEVILRNEKRILQEAVDALLDNSMRRGADVFGILAWPPSALSNRSLITSRASTAISVRTCSASASTTPAVPSSSSVRTSPRRMRSAEAHGS